MSNRIAKKLDKILLIVSLFVTIALFVIELIFGETNIGITTVKIAIILPIALLFYSLNSYKLFLKSIKILGNKDFFNEITLTLIATIAAFAIQEFVEGLAIIVFYKIGEAFEDYATRKSRESIKSTVNLRADNVILQDGSIAEPFDVKLGDIIIVKPGERVPIDGIIIDGSTSIDTSSITGESIPRQASIGDEILSGVLVLDSVLKVQTTKLYTNSTMYKIMDIVENATNVKAKPVKFITKFARIYTPIVIALAFSIAIFVPLFVGISNAEIWYRYIRIGASFLVISCPCALVLSVPMSYFVSLGEASKHKTLIKGSVYLDRLAETKQIYLDKTGTLTKGNFVLTDIVPVNKDGKMKLLNYLKLGEAGSNHPIAKAINSYNFDTTYDKEKLSERKEIKGKGVEFKYDKNDIIIGNFEFLSEFCSDFAQKESIFTTIYVSENSHYIGCVVLKDEIKDTSISAIHTLHKMGIRKIEMLSGDDEQICHQIANECNLDGFHSKLLPFEKENIISNAQIHPIVYVGDGINDSPSLIKADVGVSMGSIGSDVAVEASDVVIMNDDLTNLSNAIKIAKRNKKVVIFNIIFAIAIKIGVMILDLIPNLPIEPYIMYLAIFADVGVTIICVLNVLILLRRKLKSVAK